MKIAILLCIFVNLAVNLPVFASEGFDSCAGKVVLPPYLNRAHELGLFEPVKPFLEVYKVARWIDLEEGDLVEVGHGRLEQLIDRVSRLVWLEPMAFYNVWTQVEWTMGWKKKMRPLSFYSSMSHEFVFEPTESNALRGWLRVSSIPGAVSARPQQEQLKFARQYIESKLKGRATLGELKIVDANPPLAMRSGFICQFTIQENTEPTQNRVCASKSRLPFSVFLSLPRIP